MASYIKWRYITALIIGIICVVIVAGCVNLISNPIRPTSSATTAPTVAPQTPKQTILQPRASPDTRNADTQTMPKQTVYNSPENGPRMPDIKGVPAPTITPTPKPTITPTPTPIVIVR